MFRYEILLNDINSCKRMPKNLRQNDKTTNYLPQNLSVPSHELNTHHLTLEDKVVSLNLQFLTHLAMQMQIIPLTHFWRGI